METARKEFVNGQCVAAASLLEGEQAAADCGNDFALRRITHRLVRVRVNPQLLTNCRQPDDVLPSGDGVLSWPYSQTLNH